MKNEFEIIRELRGDDPLFNKKQFCDNRLSAKDLTFIVENPYYAKTWEIEYLVAQWRLKVKDFKRLATYLNTRYAQEAARVQKRNYRILGVSAAITATIVTIVAIALVVLIINYNIETMIF